MNTSDELKRKQDFLLKKASGKKYLNVRLHNVYMSLLEGVFSRGDRKLCAVLSDAWKLGARFDAWDECFNFNIWKDAFLKNNISIETYLDKRTPDEVLPWGHILCCK